MKKAEERRLYTVPKRTLQTRDYKNNYRQRIRMMDRDTSEDLTTCTYCQSPIPTEKFLAHQRSCGKQSVSDVSTCSYCSSSDALKHNKECPANPANIYKTCKVYKGLVDGDPHRYIPELNKWAKSEYLCNPVAHSVFIQCMTGCGYLSGTQMMISVLGQDSSGKSSTIQCLLTGGGGKAPTNFDEFARLRSPSKSYTLMDSFGEIKKVLYQMCLADVGLLVIDSTSNFKYTHPLDGIGEHASLASSMGVELICCVNKMDLVSYNEEVYLTLKEEASEYLASFGFKVSKMAFVPMSALVGDNVVKRSEHKGATLLGELEKKELWDFKKVQELKSLRVAVDFAVRKDTHGLITGYVHSGCVEPGRKLSFVPGGWSTGFQRMSVLQGITLDKVWPGETVVFEVQRPIHETVKQGCVAFYSHSGDKPKEATSLTVTMDVIDAENIVRFKSYACTCHHIVFEVYVIDIEGILDRTSRTYKELHPNELKLGEVGVVNVGIEGEPVVVENVFDLPSMARVVFSDIVSKRVVAVGTIAVVTSELEKADKKKNKKKKPKKKEEIGTIAEVKTESVKADKKKNK